MKNLFLTIVFSVIIINIGFAQGKYFTRTGHISFFSEAALENIDAHNNQGTCILDSESGELALSVLIKGFEFEKALMQEHFNENYLESHKFPKSTFKGKITNLDDVNFDGNGKYNVKFEGDLTIHGETNAVSSAGILEVADNTINASASFPVTVKDYKIKIPKTVIDNIAKVVEVKVELKLEPYKR
ncbi:YceI family protein [Fulvivirgaceae bacterium BMA12]|uniref:YceI family protein n=1 Tax=Agaribacillus aureus TaxID=3051825 RepID=A0ABT8L9B8_9BACT|nr:YceI family protein [Fulvivirgaceae bacterium BMA12]